MAAGVCYWSGNGSYCCPCLGQGQYDVNDLSISCRECGHPLKNHFQIGRKGFLLSAKLILILFKRTQVMLVLAKFCYRDTKP